MDTTILTRLLQIVIKLSTNFNSFGGFTNTGCVLIQLSENLAKHTGDTGPQSLMSARLNCVITSDQLINHHKTLYEHNTTTVCSLSLATIANTNMAAVRNSEFQAPLGKINGKF